MPKLIGYPRTNYAGAWELSEVVDDTGGKSTIEGAARKLNRKVSGSFKAIIGSAVKFGLLTSKRELLSTTTLYKRIKHAYDKQEELVFHREAFLTPPLFTQLCRKFRSRELPVQMLDVMLMREFGVEEINAQGVARAFVEGARMVGLLDDHNTIADIDLLGVQQSPRRELSNPPPPFNTFRVDSPPVQVPADSPFTPHNVTEETTQPRIAEELRITEPIAPLSNIKNTDPIANLFGLMEPKPLVFSASDESRLETTDTINNISLKPAVQVKPLFNNAQSGGPTVTTRYESASPAYKIQINGPGIDTLLSISDEEDLNLVEALMGKIRRQLNSRALK